MISLQSSDFALVIYMLNLTGLSLGSHVQPTRRKVLNCTGRVVAIAMHVYMVYRVALIVYRALVKGWTMKMGAPFAIRDALCLVIWHCMRNRRRPIRHMFKILGGSTMRMLGANHGSGKTNPLKNRIKMTIIFVFLLITLSSSLRTALLDEEGIRKEVQKLYFGMTTTSTGSGSILVFLALEVYVLYVVFFPSLVSVLYFFLCTALIADIQDYRRSLRVHFRHFKVAANFNRLINLYSTVESLDSALDLPIFYVLSVNVVILFTGLAYALGYYQILATGIGILTRSLVNFISCFSIIIIAAKVNHEILDLRKYLLFMSSEITENLLQKKRTDFYQKASLIDPTLLTGWKMFTFTKGSILTICGSLLTYGLLILQLKE